MLKRKEVVFVSTLASLVAAGVLGLAAGPAFAQNNGVPAHLEDIDASIVGLHDTVANVFDLLRPRTIFVTSSIHDGDLGGLTGADAICQTVADAPGSIVPQAEYLALLSTSSVAVSARMRASSGPYIRSDGTPIAAGFAELFATRGGGVVPRELINTVNLDEQGQPAAGNTVWTASASSGWFVPGSSLSPCDDWTSSDFGLDAVIGANTLLDQNWLGFAIANCNETHHLYCVQK